MTHLNGVVQTLDARVEGEVVEGSDGGSLPALLLRPLDLQHVVAVHAAEHDVVRVGLRVHLLLGAQLHIDILRLK